MSEPWIILESGLGEPAFNMALDEALLETAVERGAPLLRLYGWQQPAASFGYSQRWVEVMALTALRPLIRRPTGGGVVPHDRDWTYSVVIPPGHTWYGLRARESYRRIHLWVCEALNRIGVSASLAMEPVHRGGGACFVGAEEADVLCGSTKVAGAAQRRNRLGLLIQGSVQPPKGGWEREAFHQALRRVGEQAWGCFWQPGVLTETLAARAAWWVETKYGLSTYNRGR